MVKTLVDKGTSSKSPWPGADTQRAFPFIEVVAARLIPSNSKHQHIFPILLQ